MPVPGLDAARCAKRNRSAARRGLNAVPIRLLAKAPPPIDTSDPDIAKRLRVVTARGTIPSTPDAALERINTIRGEDAERLGADDVHIVYCEAGNSNFISKYFMHLADSTLRNIARRAGRSIAFMNSHRTGGMSTPAELPYGRTFAGRWEQCLAADDRAFSRTLLGVYMLRGVKPNGDGGPSTDELYEGIQAGTVFDVSLGIQGGDEICDVCGNELDAYDAEGRQRCPHMPGTHYRMTDEEIQASIKRGVPKGVASFTLEDATAGEVSSVFDGAVPGAGFRKVLRAAKSRQLSAVDLEEARLSFAPLVRRRDFQPEGTSPTRGRIMPLKKKTVPLSSLVRLLQEHGVEIEEQEDLPEPTPAPVPRPASAPPDPAPAPARPASDSAIEDRFRALEETNARLEATLTAEREQRRKDAVADRRATVLAQASNWAESQIRLGTAIPAERDELVSLYSQAAMDDHEHPAQVSYRDSTNTPKTGSRVQALSAVWGRRGQHGFSREHLSSRPDDVSEGARPNAGPGPLVNLETLPTGASADPLGDRMASAAEAYAKRINGRATPAAN